jgi:SAM-dependent methyltransferase
MELRATFDTAAALYDRVRPGYPPELYADLEQVTGLRAAARALEIGPGTGIATVAMAQRGYRITAIELGANLAAVARHNLAAYPDCTVEVARFEEWPLPTEPFDLIYSATAFHWIDPTVRFTKAAAALRPGGWLAVWNSEHVGGGTGQFFIDAQDCYERWDPATPPGLRLTPPDQFPDNSLGVEDAPGFDAPIFRRYLWEEEYTAERYIELLQTYSGHIALDDTRRGGLLTCIRGLIEERYGGVIRKAYLTQLMLARRR